MLSCSMRGVEISCVKRKAALVIGRVWAYIDPAVCASRQVITSLGPYSILRELSLTRPVGLVTWCPPTSVGAQDRKAPSVAVDRTLSSCSRAVSPSGCAPQGRRTTGDALCACGALRRVFPFRHGTKNRVMPSFDLSPCLLNMCVYGPVRSGKPCFPPFVLCHSGTCHDLQNP